MMRLPLLWRVFLSTTIATTLLFAVIAYVVQSHLVRTASAMLEEELRSSFRAYRSLWTSRADHLASLSRAISGMSDVRAAFGTGDEATIRDTAAELWSRVSEQDAIFLVTAPDGRTIASLSGSAFRPPRRVDAVASVSGSFPRQATGFSFLGDRLFQVVVTPVYVDASGGPALINVLVAGYAVDDAFAYALKNAAGGSEAVIAAGGKVVAATVAGDTALRIAAAEAQPDRLEHVEAGGSAWSVLAMELPAVGGGRLGDLRVFRPFTFSRAVEGLRMQIAGAWALAILFAFLITYILARRVLRPVRLLDDAAREVARGNFGHRVDYAEDDEMGRLALTFNAMSESIRKGREELIRQERITTLGRVASSIVHDLRNPLAAIYGGAEMLVDAGTLPPAQTQRLAANIYRASRQILTLLDDLTAITRGKAPERETCRLSDVVEDAWASVEPMADEAGVQFTLEQAGAVEANVARARLERVFVNLFTNAIQAMPSGGSVHARVEESDGAAVVTVEDDGPGIPPAIRENLFQPFTTAGKSNGLGLGLALSRQTVLDHGGDLTLGTAASGGACFRVRLPRSTGA